MGIECSQFSKKNEYFGGEPTILLAAWLRFQTQSEIRSFVQTIDPAAISPQTLNHVKSFTVILKGVVLVPALVIRDNTTVMIYNLVR